MICLKVCVGVINKLINRLENSEKGSPEIIEQKFRDFCLESKKAENRFVSDCKKCFSMNFNLNSSQTSAIISEDSKNRRLKYWEKCRNH